MLGAEFQCPAELLRGVPQMLSRDDCDPLRWQEERVLRQQLRGRLHDVCEAVAELRTRSRPRSDATGSKGHIDFLADGAGDFAKALGLEFDASAGGLGVRSKRYAMLVDDGVVKQLNIEPEPGKADVSSAAHLLEQMK